MDGWPTQTYIIIGITLGLLLIILFKASKTLIFHKPEQSQPNSKKTSSAQSSPSPVSADQQRKEEFKRNILASLQSEIKSKQNELRSEILEKAMNDNNFKIEKTRAQAITDAARNVFREFRKKFFNNLKRMVLQNDIQRKDKKGSPSKYQEQAIKEAEEALTRREEIREMAERQKQYENNLKKQFRNTTKHAQEMENLSANRQNKPTNLDEHTVEKQIKEQISNRFKDYER